MHGTGRQVVGLGDGSDRPTIATRDAPWPFHNLFIITGFHTIGSTRAAERTIELHARARLTAGPGAGGGRHAEPLQQWRNAEAGPPPPAPPETADPNPQPMRRRVAPAAGPGRGAGGGQAGV